MYTIQMPLRWTHVAACGRSVFLFIGELYSILCTYHHLLIHSPAAGHLDCFPFSDYDKDAVNIHAFVWTNVFIILGKYLEAE